MLCENNCLPWAFLWCLFGFILWPLLWKNAPDKNSNHLNFWSEVTGPAKTKDAADSCSTGNAAIWSCFGFAFPKHNSGPLLGVLWPSPEPEPQLERRLLCHAVVWTQWMKFPFFFFSFTKSVPHGLNQSFGSERGWELPTARLLYGTH